ncbi:MAG TPA: AIPR family protein [Bacteroidales bacterium]|nr:AIPR family protein [Bacteroidales bacterium]
MITTIEKEELSRYYQDILQEIKTIQISVEEGGALEQIFTQTAVDLLASAGETENVMVAYDESSLGRKNQHKINAYSISENYETIDLFITIYKGTDEITRIAKEEIDTAAKRILNFFTKGISRNYVNEIEESSMIFDLANTLNESDELREYLVRVNAIILTDGIYPGEIPNQTTVADFPLYFRVVDLNYIYDITEKEHIPIEIDFKSYNFNLPCIISPLKNDQYQSYLAIIPGRALAMIYEKYGSRLLEQNVRSFLQFTGKINKGIRETITTRPEMFLAYNNGISATAESVEIEQLPEGKGYIITKVKDFQIVNGGQTTASIYHTHKKYVKSQIDSIYVQMKLNVVNNKDQFSEIVSRISEYANTQNKIAISDLSSNRPYHISLEKISRSILAPLLPGKSIRTRWFYERTRGQYKNARLKAGNSIPKRKAFDATNPKSQVINKEELAKYLNSYQEIVDGKRLLIGPHVVVKGNQKNYKSFIDHNLTENIDNVYFEDLVAKAILFRTFEKIYGIKPNAIGDLRYITVPYAISLFGYLTDYKLDLYKIWLNQSISAELLETIREFMCLVEYYIKESAPGALYGEWAKNAACWISLKDAFATGQYKDTDLKIPASDLQNSSGKSRKRISNSDVEKSYYEEIEATIKSIQPEKWKEIYLYCKDNPDISEYLTTAVHNLGRKLKEGIRPSTREIIIVNDLLTKVQYKTGIFDLEPVN